MGDSVGQTPGATQVASIPDSATELAIRDAQASRGNGQRVITERVKHHENHVNDHRCSTLLFATGFGRHFAWALVTEGTASITLSFDCIAILQRRLRIRAQEPECAPGLGSIPSTDWIRRSLDATMAWEISSKPVRASEDGSHKSQ